MKTSREVQEMIYNGQFLELADFYRIADFHKDYLVLAAQLRHDLLEFGRRCAAGTGMKVGPEIRVRVIAAPAGEAPEYIREQWVGCEMEVLYIDVTATPVLGVLSGEIAPKDANKGGYVIKGSEAMRSLAVYAKLEALRWWEEHAPRGMGFFEKDLVFGRQFCEEVQNEKKLDE